MRPWREKLQRGEPLFGAFQSLPSPVAGEALGQAGADFVVADIQHGALDHSNLLSVIYGIEAGGAAPFVRTARCDPAEVMRALDLGASGVIVPMVSTPQDAAMIGGAMRYGPVGTRSIGPVRGQYLDASAGDQPLCLAMIETVEGLDNINAIAATAGIDGLFLGPGDLSLSMGLGLSAEPHPAVTDALHRMVAACRTHGLIAGTVGLQPAAVGPLCAAGVTFLALGSDRHFIAQGMGGLLAQAPDSRAEARDTPS